MITPSLVPSRTSGVAPLAVYFDAGATTSTNTSKPRHECFYSFNYGDQGSGTYTYGRQVSKNAIFGGPWQAHCFETPGTYTVSLVVFDGVSIGNASVTITVTDPDVVFPGKTLVISHDGDFTGAPSGDQATDTDWDNIINTRTGHGATYQRIRIKKGGSYTAGSSWTITAGSGPGLIDTWGTGAKPAISDPVGFFPGNTTNFTFGDWRFVDLSFDGVSSAVEAVQPAGGASKMTWLRCEWTRVNSCFNLLSAILDAINTPSYVVPMWSEWAVVDCRLDQTTGAYTWGGSCLKIMLLGNYHNMPAAASGGHTVRTALTQGGAITSCYLGKADRTSLTVRGLTYTSPGATANGDPAIGGTPFTQQICVSDCTIEASDTTAFVITVVSSNPGDDDRHRDIIIERNMITSGTSVGFPILTESSDYTQRNNVHVTKGGGNVMAITKDANTPFQADYVHVCNETVYDNATAATGLIVAYSGNTPTNVLVENCLAWAPNNSGTMDMVSVTGATERNNSSALQMHGTDPSFVSATPTVAADFKIQTSSYAKGAGFTATNYADFFAVSRYGVTYDMGFHQYTQGTYPWLAGSPPSISPRMSFTLP